VSDYLINGVLQAVRTIVDQAGIANRNRQVYDMFMQRVFTPGSPQQIHLFQTLDQVTQGRWRNGVGVHEQELYAYLKPWITGLLTQIDQFLTSRNMAQPQSGIWGSGQSSQPMGNLGPLINANPNLYSDGTRSTPQAQPTLPMPEIISHTSFAAGHTLADINLGKDVMIELRRAPHAEIRQLDGGILTLDNYQTGAHDNERLTTIDITLNVAQNDARHVGFKVFNLAPQEVIRGTFANVVRYHELFHIPMSQNQFIDVATAVGEAYFNDTDNWHVGVEVLNKRTKGEWFLMSTALCRLINRSMHRRMRTTEGAVIEGIEEIDDLALLDDRNSKITVTHHPKYWSAFNILVNLAFTNLFAPKNLIRATDTNFGDFVHCDHVELYLDGRSKYDYGTYAERVDQKKFIDKMLETNTVLRIPRTIVLTNALDRRLIQIVQNYQNTDQLLLSKTQTVGTALLGKLDFVKRNEIESVICLDSTVSPNDYFQHINLGRTLDEDIVLIR